MRRSIALTFLLGLLVTGAAQAAPLRIVAVGASNTSGWMIRGASAYPAVLERLLHERGIEAKVTNAGVPFDTTAKMLARLVHAVPDGTDVAVLQPGGNDLRFFGTRAARAANIESMVESLKARSIHVIVYDETIPWRYVFDGIHLTPAGHVMIAEALLPQVLAWLETRKKPPARAPRVRR